MGGPRYKRQKRQNQPKAKPGSKITPGIRAKETLAVLAVMAAGTLAVIPFLHGDVWVPLVYFVLMTLCLLGLALLWPSRRAKAFFGILVVIVAICCHVWYRHIAGRLSSPIEQSSRIDSPDRPKGETPLLDGPKNQSPSVNNLASRSSPSAKGSQRAEHGSIPSKPDDNRFSDFRVLRTGDYYAEIEVSYYYNGAAGKDDVEASFWLLRADGSRFSSGEVMKMPIIGYKAVLKINPTYSSPTGEIERSTQAELCMEQGFAYFHCQRFPFVKIWKPFKRGSD